MKHHDPSRRFLPESAVDYESCLNPAQLEAVLTREGPLLVVAGAGSGKTRTVTYRVARLVEDGIPPSSILLLTFTRKASQEMLHRCTELLDDRCRRVAGGTFHSFAHAVLRRHAGRIGFPDGYAIVDRSDAESLIAALRKEFHSRHRERSFPTKKTLADIFSRSVNKGRDVQDIVMDEYPHLGEDIESIVELQHRYAASKMEHRVVDYDDLLLLLERLLREEQAIRAKSAETYRYILVDEYQDTNILQAKILHLIGADHRNVMVVGDDSQSIYAFRGANFENIMRFPEMFPGTRIIKLEENYRSTQPILDVTNAIIAQARRKFTKHLFTRNAGGMVPQLVQTPNEKSQSRWVIDTVAQLRRCGIRLGRIAVLFRASYHSFDLEIELNREGIAFIKVGGFKFMESAHVKDVLAHLRVLANPYDRISWLRSLMLLDRIGPKTAQAVYDAVVRVGRGHEGLFAGKDRCIVRKELDGLRDLFRRLEAIPRSHPGELGTAVLAYYKPLAEKMYDDHPRRVRDLEQLTAIMERYESLESFLADMALEPPTAAADNHLTGEWRDPDRLTLSTVHSAKGLEWDAVFVLWALDGRFPSQYALEKEKDLEEELRLMYVAATRARERLYFLCPAYAFDRATGTVLNRPARFVADLPENLLERVYLEGMDGSSGFEMRW